MYLIILYSYACKAKLIPSTEILILTTEYIFQEVSVYLLIKWGQILGP